MKNISNWSQYCNDAVYKGLYNETISSLVSKIFIITSQSPLSPPFESLKHAMKEHSIPFHYPLEYIEGLSMDLDNYHYQSLEELVLYCYRSSSTIQLMKSHVKGITNERSLESIKDLAISIQLAQITYNLKKCYRRGRCYIPDELLNKYEVTKEEVFHKNNQDKLHLITQDLISLANEFYQSGIKDLSCLPVSIALDLFIQARLQLMSGPRWMIILQSSLFYFINFYPQKLNHRYQSSHQVKPVRFKYHRKFV
ncbi:MAG TPA: squalene/phytoene synthase family protein [Bacteriovoracaceae bacterium]|nr:squalene/phytoene synthase family protein [Bacteriovoracaceae bacterium]